LRDLAETRNIPRFECPICRNPINTNINDIPKNRFIVQYLETLNQNRGSETTSASTSFSHNTHTDNKNYNDFSSNPSAPPSSLAQINSYQSNSYHIPVSYENTAHHE
jgi:hypothetical protein